jgi:Mor family transcriptional regulator
VKTKKYDSRSVVADMIDGCAGAAGRTEAVRGIRALCKYFGGQYIYIPVHKANGKTTEELRNVLRDAAGEQAGALILEKLMALFEGVSVYIPQEKKAFHRLIAQEIYDRYDGIGNTIGDFCREYGMSFNTVYKLYHEGRDEKLQGKFEFTEEQ